MATHDYSGKNRCWGHDYTFDPIDFGRKAKMSGWGRGINPGDFLIIDNHDIGNGETTRYQIEEIRYCDDPPDMWFAYGVFSPRPERAN